MKRDIVCERRSSIAAWKASARERPSSSGAAWSKGILAGGMKMASLMNSAEEMLCARRTDWHARSA